MSLCTNLHKRKFTVLAILITCNTHLWSCQNRNNITNLSKYFSENYKVHGIDNYKIFIFIPLNSCEFCLHELISFFKERKSVSCTAIIISGINNPEIKPSFNLLSHHKKYLFKDVGYKYFSYGLSNDDSPFFLEMKNGRYIYHKITPDSVKEELRFLDNFYSQNSKCDGL